MKVHHSIYKIIHLCVCAIIISSMFFSTAHAVAGIPSLLSYQGRLTDASGTLLGGSGASYYFKFSLWNTATVGTGTQVWPATAPQAVMVPVSDGVFSVIIGDTASGYPDPLTYTFQDTDTVYLQIQVSANGADFETLGPRQRIVPNATAINAKTLQGLTPGTGANNLLQLGTNGEITLSGNGISSLGNVVLGTVSSGVWNGSLITDQYFEKTGNWQGTFNGQQASYYTDASNLTNFSLPFLQALSAVTTDDITEGVSNLYFTNARAIAALTGLYEVPLTFSSPLSRSGNTISLTQATSSQDGYLSASDWTTFNNKQNALGYTPYNATNPAGYISASSTDTLTNKSGNISQWTNDTGYLTSLTNSMIVSTLASQSIPSSKLIGTDITTVGTITSGIWQGTSLADAYIASAPTWNAKQDALQSGTSIKTINGNSLLESGDLSFGLPSGSDGYIQFASGGTFASDVNLFWDATNKRLGIGTITPSAKLAIMAGGTGYEAAFTVTNSNGNSFVVQDNGNVGIGGYFPSGHTVAAGYRALWMDTSNSGFIGETSSGYKGINIVANVVRNDTSTWGQQDTARNSFMLSLGYEASNNGFALYRAAAGSGNTFTTLFSVNENGGFFGGVLTLRGNTSTTLGSNLTTNNSLLVSTATGSGVLGISGYSNSGAELQTAQNGGVSVGGNMFLQRQGGTVSIGGTTTTAKFNIIGDTLSGSATTPALLVEQNWNTTTGAPSMLRMNYTGGGSTAYNSGFISANNNGSNVFLLDKTGSLSLGTNSSIYPNGGNLTIGSFSTTIIKANGSSSILSLVNNGYTSLVGAGLTGTANATLFDMTQTWNTSGTVTGLRMAITDTASNANAMLIDVYGGSAGTARMFGVTKAGTIIIRADQSIINSSGGSNHPHISFGTTGMLGRNWVTNLGRFGINASGYTTPRYPFDIHESTNSFTASGGIGYLANVGGTLVASANNTVLSGLNITTTFTNGSFTGLTNNLITARTAGTAVFSVDSVGNVNALSNSGGFVTSNSSKISSISNGLSFNTPGIYQFTTNNGIMFTVAGNTSYGGHVFTGQTLTSASTFNLLTLSQTWNTSASPTALLVNITNTASGSTSKLLDLQISGTGSMFYVDKTGNTYISGNLGVGVTTPSYMLSVGSSAVSGDVAGFTNSAGTCTINPTTTSLSCPSDMRLKKDIVTLASGTPWSGNVAVSISQTASLVEKIMTVTPVYYHWNSETSEDMLHAGFIAQQVEQVFPDLVSTNQEGFKSLNYAGFIPYVVQAQQLQQASLDALTVRVQSIESLLAATKQQTVLSAAVAALQDIVARKVTVSKGFEMKDQDTGDVYCVVIRSGEWQKTKGECDAEQQPAPSSVTTVSTPEQSTSEQSTSEQVVLPDVVAPTTSERVENSTPVNEPSAQEPQPSQETAPEVLIQP